MQRIFCFILLLIPVDLLAQEKIDFFRQAVNENACKIVTTHNNGWDQSAGNCDNHTLEIIFLVSAARQQAYKNLTGVLSTQSGRLSFVFNGETQLKAVNNLVFTSAHGKLYVFLNEILRCTISDETHVFDISHPGFACSLGDATSASAIAFQIQSVTARYRHYDPGSDVDREIATQNKICNVLSVFPDPAHTTLNIRIAKPAFIRVFDAVGNLQFTKNISGRLAVDVSQLAAGLYFIYVTTKDAQQFKQSFIKL